MKDVIDTIWNFPAKHVALGWWLAAAFTFWNVIASVTGRALTQVKILGYEFQKDQLIKRIRLLEYLHDNTNALVRHLAIDFVEVAIEMSAILIIISVVLMWVFSMRGTAIFMVIGTNVGTNIIGRAWRIRIMLRDLDNFPTSVQTLRRKLDKLNS